METKSSQGFTFEAQPINTFDDLKQKFPVLPVRDLGDCLAIPGEELDLDWILMFLEEGYRFEGSRLNGDPVVLVQVKPMAIDGPENKIGVPKKEASQ